MLFSLHQKGSQSQGLDNSSFYKMVEANLIDKGLNRMMSENIADVITYNQLKSTFSFDSNVLTSNIHLVPLTDYWIALTSDGSEIIFSDEEYGNALLQARLIAKKYKVKLIVHCTEGRVKDVESFQVNRPYVRAVAF